MIKAIQIAAFGVFTALTGQVMGWHAPHEIALLLVSFVTVSVGLHMVDCSVPLEDLETHRVADLARAGGSALIATVVATLATGTVVA